MSVFIQKHRLHPIWKFYDANKMFLGQIQGATKEGMAELANVLLPFLSEGEVSGYRKEILADKSINVFDVSTNKRVANFEKDFAEIANAIVANQ